MLEENGLGDYLAAARIQEPGKGNDDVDEKHGKIAIGVEEEK